MFRELYLSRLFLYFWIIEVSWIIDGILLSCSWISHDHRRLLLKHCHLRFTLYFISNFIIFGNYQFSLLVPIFIGWSIILRCRFTWANQNSLSSSIRLWILLVLILNIDYNLRRFVPCFIHINFSILPSLQTINNQRAQFILLRSCYSLSIQTLEVAVLNIHLTWIFM